MLKRLKEEQKHFLFIRVVQHVPPIIKQAQQTRAHGPDADHYLFLQIVLLEHGQLMNLHNV